MQPIAELGAFLRHKRSQTSPAAVGLPAAQGRRAPGLRREEVAMLAGVGLTWYTWMEQGRDIRPSRQVVDAIAQTLRLSPAEHEYALRLAGHDSPGRGTGELFPPHGWQVLAAFGSSPAYAMAWDWTVVAWNDAYAALYPTISRTPAAERNLLWLIWTDPTVRELLADWATDSRRFVAMYRADLGPRLGSSQTASLVARLRHASDDFAAAWDSHDVDGFTSRTRTFLHPEAGRLELEQHQLSFRDAPGVQIVVYTAAPGSEASLERLPRKVCDQGSSSGA